MEVMLNNMIYNDSQQSLSISTAAKEISEKDLEIKNLNANCSTLHEEIEGLKLALVKFEQKELDCIKWEKMYHEMNSDFQKILTDHRNLLKHIDDQNSIINNLTDTLNSQKVFEIPPPYGSDFIDPTNTVSMNK
ncbi:hypothetical protein MXB_991 [Myxobolus squamalis]|nr:hypothetical protein MXB_991 [Myxobolus squamalis]